MRKTKWKMQKIMAGIVVSAAWMVLILVGLLLPALFYVNS